jgi:hypothetical protein
MRKDPLEIDIEELANLLHGLTSKYGVKIFLLIKIIAAMMYDKPMFNIKEYLREIDRIQFFLEHCSEKNSKN